MPDAALPREESGPTVDALAPCFVYVLGSFGKGGYRTYVGWSCDVDRRLAQHNNGTGARSTKGRTWTLLYVELHATRRAAMSREWHLKRDRGFRRQFAQRTQPVASEKVGV
ncbi:MAG TPA: GIY-YIG nuclease family protein [Dongiaceae bacterium]|jgi:putative endonuclease|nr:GIY-YIG nuclease family protein [Dongiaceae bacterium]